MRLHKLFSLAFAVVLSVVTPLAAHAQNTITTVAGGIPNHVPALKVSIGDPAALVADSFGNIYISPSSVSAVYKLDASGNLSLYAGNGVYGYGGDGGPATSAQLGEPAGLAVDPAGDLFIADSNNNVIREVPATTIGAMTAGNIYTVAGNGGNGYGGDGQPATTAELNFPIGVAVDSFGNLFIADYNNQRVREVPAVTTGAMTQGYMYTVAGTGVASYNGDNQLATSATLQYPTGVAVDSFGNLFIADFSNQRVREVPATTVGAMTAGNIYTVAGNGVGGYNADGIAATTAWLSYPQSVAVDSFGNLFIADVLNQRVREVPAVTVGAMTAGNIYTVAGNGVGGYNADGIVATSAWLFYPENVAVDSFGNLFIADSNNQRVREVPATTTGTMTVSDIYTVAGNGYFSYSGDGRSAISAQLGYPTAISSDASGDFFIADSGNNVTREVLAATGNIQNVAGNGTPGYAGDGGSASGPSSTSQLANPYGVFLDSFGNVFVADTGNCVIREVVAATGIIQTVAGIPQTCGYAGDGGLATGPTSTARLSSPTGVFVDGSGNLFIADDNNCVVREVMAATGVIQTVAGTPQSCGYAGDTGPAAGPTSTAKLSSPTGIFVDGSGNLFIADSQNCVIREVSAVTSGAMTAGSIYTVAGNGSCNYSGDGTPAANATATLSYPSGVFLDSSGNLFIADSGNNVIREVPATTVVTPNGTLNALSIYTVVGNGSGYPGYSGDGGPALSATLAYPLGLAAGPSGSLLIADSNNNAIRSVAGLLVNPWLSLSASNLPFAAQAEGTSSAAQTVTLSNTGTAPLTVNTLAVGGANSADFLTSMDTCTGSTLAPNATCTVNVTYAPSVVGAENATLTIVDTANSPRTVSLSGTGVIITAILGSTNLAFGSQNLGNTSAAQTVTLTNLGTAALSISSLAVGGTNSADFTETDNCAGSVAAGSSCTLSVKFTPSAAGSRTATIAITDNAPASPQTVSLSGTGVGSGVSLSPASLTFSTTYVGVAATAQTVTLTNNGTAALAISSIAVGGTNSADFAQTNTCGTSVAVGAKCPISVTFRPSATGSRSASITITDNANGGPQTVSLNGAGISASLSMAGNGATTQTVSAGKTATYNLQLTATGGTATDQVSATITCTGAPTLANCSASPATVTATPATSGTFAITVTTTGGAMLLPNGPSTPQSEQRMQPPAALRTMPLAILTLLLTIATMLLSMQNSVGRLRTVRLTLVACVVLLPVTSAMFLTGCAGGPSSSNTSTPSTPAGTYTITVTATASGKSQSTPLTLIVQ